jgi:molybdopterin-containing oxidoreductase family iron-sulfur binding subunit
MTLSGAAADRRLCQLLTKQALVHIYNIVTGSSVAVSLDKFKSEVTKAQQLKQLAQRSFGLRYSR